MVTYDLTGRVAIVTGGNGGIGLAMARALAKAGAKVVIAARQRAKSEEALTVIAAAGGTATFVELDAAAPESCTAAIAAAVGAFGSLDILVNNAGINIRREPEDFTPAEWQSVLDINLGGPFYCAQAAFPVMKAGGGGKIVNVGSIYSVFGAPKVAAYSASKGGVAQLTKSLATAWAQYNIQVNALLPGWIDTELTVGARRDVPGLNDTVANRTPAGRWGVPEDLAGPLLFLASGASDFVTGALLPVDGGFLARG